MVRKRSTTKFRKAPMTDVHEAECHVGGFLLEVLLLLQGHKVSKANGGECDEAVVVSVEEAPSLKVPNTQCSNAGQEAHQHHVLHGHLGAATAQALLHLMEQIADKCVHPFSQALEHDQSERNAQHSMRLRELSDSDSSASNTAAPTSR
ncbi:hypothetical protein F7725_000945 [Dissostichus mawsoni]|uniref:Uncharacterized protein n=1 Tax=Dissostichus mawsoni TaxID=36200 RepID=A0A7J5ZGC3_DISMA|nr:hypothetical protein F7725_000945 [Dissostichus mawsoni]